MTIIIGQPINGISINGLEYLLMPNSTGLAEFEDEAQAKQFLRDQGFVCVEADDGFVYEEIGNDS